MMAKKLCVGKEMFVSPLRNTILLVYIDNTFISDVKYELNYVVKMAA